MWERAPQWETAHPVSLLPFSLKWGSGNALSGTHASKTPHFLECLGCAEEADGNFWLLHVHFSTAAFSFVPRPPPQPAGCSPLLLISSLKMSLLLPWELNSIICSYYLAFGIKSICFTNNWFLVTKGHAKISSLDFCVAMQNSTPSLHFRQIFVWSGSPLLY